MTDGVTSSNRISVRRDSTNGLVNMALKYGLTAARRTLEERTGEGGGKEGVGGRSQVVNLGTGIMEKRERNREIERDVLETYL